MNWLRGLIAFTASLMFAAIAHAGPRAQVAGGLLEGALENGVSVYKNVPFAAPPTGALRWRPPASAPAWTGVRDATAYGAACPQPERGDGGGGGRADFQDEDCLTLNVWAPQAAQNLPVMVWLHGGAHRIGSGTFPIYDGGALARQGVIVVTVNYRLGPLGYFAHPALTGEAGPDDPLGNYGMLDQIAALEWVHKNIAALGGDPTRVTVFGESAGGTSIVFLLANARARGLFQQAIIESGGGLQNPGTLAPQERRGVEIAAKIGLPATASANEMRALPATQWVTAAGSLQGAGFGPFIDGRLVREAPWRAILEARAPDIPLLLGANDNEASVLTTLGVSTAALTTLAGAREPELRALYGDVSQQEYARQAMGDAFFVAPSVWMARQTAAGASSFLYHFTYVAERRRGDVPGANHGSEIPYVFQTWDRLPLPAGFLTEQDRAFAAMMSSCWISFAKTGAPVCDKGPAWPAFDEKDQRLMVFSPQSQVAPPPRQAALDFMLARFMEHAK